MEHKETECNIVLAGGKLKLQFCIVCLLYYLVLVVDVAFVESLLFQYEDELSICPLFNKCYEK